MVPLFRHIKPSSKDDLPDTELNFDSSSRDESMEGRVEEATKPPEDSVAATESNTPEGTMVTSSPTDTTSQENTVNQPTAIRLMPKPINPSALSTLQWAKQKQVSGRMLDGYESSGGSPINLEAVMMVAFNQLESSGQVNIMAQN
jgi:hypothetical protein